jgi:hypothetical protein
MAIPGTELAANEPFTIMATLDAGRGQKASHELPSQYVHWMEST